MHELMIAPAQPDKPAPKEEGCWDKCGQCKATGWHKNNCCDKHRINSTICDKCAGDGWIKKYRTNDYRDE